MTDGATAGAAGAAEPPATEVPTPEELAALREKAARADEMQDRYLRSVADLENFRKRAAREADYLRHASAELQMLAPQEGEETQLAERRTIMMQGEKIATDLREAQEAIGGAHSPVPALSAAVRRLERRAAGSPALVEPAVKAIDAAINALEEADQYLNAALRAADFDPAELERIEERLFGLRAAARKYSTPVDRLAALAVQMAADLLRPSVAGSDGERFLDLLHRSARRGGEIIQQLLLFGRGVVHSGVDAQPQPLMLVREIDQSRKCQTCCHPDDAPGDRLLHLHFACVAMKHPQIKRKKGDDNSEKNAIRDQLQVAPSAGRRFAHGEIEPVQH